MELSPEFYHILVRPKWFSNMFYNAMFNDCINFKGKKVLDFGCGIGSSSYLFKPSTYVGIDCDSKRIEYAKKLYPSHKFMAIEDHILPLPPNSIDHVLILSVLHHIPSESLFGYLKEFRKVLKPEGSIIVVEPCFFEKARFQNWCMSKLDKGRYIRCEEEYLNIFKKSDYNTKVIKRYNQLLFYNKIMFLASPN
ncbi:class I SAM-dependent methyltransferase [Lutispora sp.]|uniref:class I SAM-dependent methyltransferase n=1 Tax=Lutispora sp. TaxID=2828727 RepID=UPI0035660B4B